MSEKNIIEELKTCIDKKHRMIYFKHTMEHRIGCCATRVPYVCFKCRRCDYETWRYATLRERRAMKLLGITK